jgi:hypothetical protein
MKQRIKLFYFKVTKEKNPGQPELTLLTCHSWYKIRIRKKLDLKKIT